MAPPEYPTPPFIVDITMLTSTYIYERDNVKIATIEKLFEIGELHTTSRTRADFKREDQGAWDGYDLNRIQVHNQNRELKRNAGLLIEECNENDLHMHSTSIAPKINLITLAKLNGARVISSDNGPSPISMKSLCELFDVEFFDFSVLCNNDV